MKTRFLKQLKRIFTYTFVIVFTLGVFLFSNNGDVFATTTVHFNKNHNDTTGYTDPVPMNKTVTTNDPLGPLPNPPIIRVGYTFAGWYANQAGTGDAFIETTTISAPTQFTLYAKWTPIQYTFNYNVITPGTGSISPEPSFTLNLRDNITGIPITATPALGYSFIGWSDGKQDNPRTDTLTPAFIMQNPTTNNNYTYTAEFTNLHTITYLAGVGGRIIDGNPVHTVNNGEDTGYVTVAPNSGWQFVRWSDGNTQTRRNLTNVTSSKTITAQFTQTTNNIYTVTYTAGANGRIEGDTTHTALHGGSTVASVTAIPNEGYEFFRWSDGLTDPTRREQNLTQALSLFAEFDPLPPPPSGELTGLTYTVAYTAGPNGSIEGLVMQNIQGGGNGTSVTAIPSEGYKFVQWSDGSKEPTRREDLVSSNLSFTATFEKMDEEEIAALLGKGGLPGTNIFRNLTFLTGISIIFIGCTIPNESIGKRLKEIKKDNFEKNILKNI